MKLKATKKLLDAVGYLVRLWLTRPVAWIDRNGVPCGTVSDEQLVAVFGNAIVECERRSGLPSSRTVTAELKIDTSEVLAALPQMQAVLKAVDLVLWWDSRLGGTSVPAILRDAIDNLRTAATALQ